MSKYIDPDLGCWIVKCDWVEDGEVCGKTFVDPDGGRNPEKEFQCGSHHGVIPQADRPEFQVPDDVEENEDVLTRK